MHGADFIKAAFFLITILIFSLKSHSGTFCDDLVCERDGVISIQSQNASGIQNGLAIDIQELNLPISPPENPTPIRNSTTTEISLKGQLNNPTAAEPQSDQSQQSDTASPATQSSTPPPASQTVTESSSINQPLPTTGGNTSKIGGFIYSNDDDDSRDKDDDIDVDTPKSQNQFTNNAQTALTPSNSFSKKGTTSTPPQPLASSGNNGQNLFGNYTSGAKSGTVAAASNNPNNSVNKDALNKMKGASGHFGASGSIGGSGRKGKKRRNSNRSQGRRLASIDKLNLNKTRSTSALQRRLLRKLASTGQLADKNAFLFFSMCQYYDSYEKSNNINYGKTQCPKK